MREKSKLLILAFLGIVISLSLLYIGLVSPITQSLKPRLKETVTKPFQPYLPQKAEVNLSLNPQEVTVYSGEILEVQVLAETKEKLIATDIELVFDPEVLIVKEAKSGIFWSKPQELTKVLDNSKGEIFYGIASVEPKSGQGIIASFKFEVKKISPSSLTTNISFEKGCQASVVGKETELKFSESGKYVILKPNE